MARGKRARNQCKTGTPRKHRLAHSEQRTIDQVTIPPRSRASLPARNRNTRRNIVIATAVALSLMLTGVMLAQRASINDGGNFGRRESSKGATGASQSPEQTIQTQSLSPGAPAKEYIYGPGGRLLAIEEASETTPPDCTDLAVSPAQSPNLPAAGASSSFNVTAQASCTWTATTSDLFIHITQGSGSGNGVVSYGVDPNAGAARTGTITVAGKTHTVNQDAAAGGCTLSLQPASQNFPASGGDGSFNVNTEAGCSWTATSTQQWITAGASGTGTGAVTFTVAQNATTSQRTGAINVTIGQTTQSFNVSQDGTSCNYSINPSSVTLQSPAGGGSVTVTAEAGCFWTAVSNNTHLAP